jgi:Growth regulator
METNVIKIGNSKGVIIPAELLKKMGLNESNAVNLTLDGDSLVMRNSCLRRNMLQTRFHVCPVCGNVIRCISDARVNCHGLDLPALEARKAPEGQISLEKVEDEVFVSIDHEMTRKNFVSFIAAVSADRVQMVELFPEGNAEARFKLSGIRDIYYYSIREGLFSVRCLVR